MKLAAWITVSDLVPMQKTLLESLIDIFFKGKKQFMFKTQPIAHIFNSLKQSGVNGLELLVPIFTSDEDITKVKVISKKYKMPIISIHQSLNSINNISLIEIERLCNIANIFTARVVVLHSGALNEKLFDHDILESLQNFQRKYNIYFGVENMPKNPFSLFRKFTYKGNEFASIMNQTGLSITFDTTHLAQAGEDISEFYLKNREKIVDIHLSDYKTHWFNKKLLLQSNTHLPLTKGELQIKKFLIILKDDSYSGIITMEIDGFLEELSDSAKLIKKYI